jgi:2-(3-amino-3-carboxypropyl)histidine synthase
MAEERLFPSFNVDVEGILDIIRKNGYRKVLLQGPEGLKTDLVELAMFLEKESMSDVWVDGEPCFGACDHAGDRARTMGAEVLIHLGHSDIPSMDRNKSTPIHFFPVFMKWETEMIHGGVGKIVNLISGSKISLFTTIQHIDLLDEVRDLLRKEGVNVHVGGPGNREVYPGQVLGCSFSSSREIPDDVEYLLFLGTGRFHPMGLALSSGRDVHTLDPISGEVGVVRKGDLDGMLRSRFGHINKFKEHLGNGERTGIIVGSKPGQGRLALAERIREALNTRDHASVMVLMDHLDPMKIRSLGLRILVNTACPRITLDDSGRYSSEGLTVLTPVELDIALGIISWTDYSFDDLW